MSTGSLRRRAAVVPAGPRLAAQAEVERSERRRRRLRWAGHAALGLVPLLALGWTLLLSGWFDVERVEVIGVERLSAEEVRGVAGVGPGTALAAVSPAEVGRAVERLRPVADVTVRRSWPRTLQLAVSERVAVAGVARDGAVLLLDEDGVAFATEPALPPGVVRLEIADDAARGPTTQAALDVHTSLPEELRVQVGALRASSPSEVELLLDGGRTIVWGAPGNAGTKASATLALLPLGGSVVDVSTPGVAVRR
jgi:cell division protein FtsQ